MYWETILQQAAWVVAAVQYLKQAFRLDGWAVRGLAIVIALIVAVFYSLTTPAQEAAWQVVAYWIGSAVVASGGRDFLKELLSFIGAKTE